MAGKRTGLAPEMVSYIAHALQYPGWFPMELQHPGQGPGPTTIFSESGSTSGAAFALRSPFSIGMAISKRPAQPAKRLVKTVRNRDYIFATKTLQLKLETLLYAFFRIRFVFYSRPQKPFSHNDNRWIKLVLHQMCTKIAHSPGAAPQNTLHPVPLIKTSKRPFACPEGMD